MRLLLAAALFWLNLLLFENQVWLAIALAITAIACCFGFHHRLELTKRNIAFFGVYWLLLMIRSRFGSIPFDLADGFGWLRDLTRQLCRGLSHDAQALVLGITAGDDSGISVQLNEQMRLLSLTHLTAVSGTNCSILIAAVFGLLAKLGFRNRGRVIGALTVLGLYLGLVGNQPSVLRAAAMSTFALLALLTRSRLNPISVLGSTIMVLIFLEPDLVSSYSFSLSSLATAGLLIFAPKLFENFSRKLPKWLALSAAVTISAQIFCLPVLAILQPEQSSLAVVANILVEPVVALITLLGISAVVASLVSHAVASSLFWLASVPAQYIVATSNWLSSLDAPVVQLGNLTWLLIVVVISCVALVKVSKLSGFAKSVISFCAVTLVALQITPIISTGFPLRAWFYVSCDVGQGDATLIRSAEKVALVDVGREPKLINRCLKRLGIEHIDLLVLTHFDADHVAGLAGALQGRTITQALVTSYEDDRPGASWIQNMLVASGIRFAKAERGMVGQLGDFRWRVLSPHHNGQDSEDPNDGSVTMLWQSAEVSIMTLADLGEKGQMRLGEELSSWDNPTMHQHPIIVKVSHHGSTDQFAELYEWLKPTVASISVGKHNSYGHPTKRTLELLRSCSQLVLRTDQLGSVAIARNGNNGLLYSSG